MYENNKKKVNTASSSNTCKGKKKLSKNFSSPLTNGSINQIVLIEPIKSKIDVDEQIPAPINEESKVKSLNLNEEEENNKLILTEEENNDENVNIERKDNFTNEDNTTPKFLKKRGRPKKTNLTKEEYQKQYYRERYKIYKDEIKEKCAKNSKKYRDSYRLLFDIYNSNIIKDEDLIRQIQEIIE